MQIAISDLDNDEKLSYIDSTANEYFRNVYYSEKFSSIVSKLDSKEELSEDEWNYLINRLYMVAYKATMEEDSFDIIDGINYVVNRVGVFLFKKGIIYNECAKMLVFLDSIRIEKDINKDLLLGIELVENSRDVLDLSILLRQHREAVLFRDNQDAFLNLYEKGITGVMTKEELTCIESMDRCYIREKELVKEYK